MPIRKVKGGYRWGKTGKVYPTREGARRQAAAIKISQQKRKKKKGS